MRCKNNQQATKLLGLRSQKDNELHLKEDRKRRDQIKRLANEYKLSNFNTHKKRDF